MNNIPSRPPVKAITVVRIMSNFCQTPISISAGIVKIIPAARDSPADAAVWIWLASRIDPASDFRLSARICLRITIPITAAGMEAETVMPAFNPK